MTILDRLASTCGRTDEELNVKLAEELAKKPDAKAVRELVEHLVHKNKALAGDCIKVLSELGERKPEQIAEYLPEFVRHLRNKNNRLAWGAMTAINSIASLQPESVYAHLPAIITAADSGSVITRDHAIGILVKLCDDPRFGRRCWMELIRQLKICPNLQLPMYAEMCLPVVSDRNRLEFTDLLASRLENLEKDSQKKRLAKLLKKAGA